MRTECDVLREEVVKWRLEVEYSELSMQELEMQSRSEQASLQSSIERLEQQVEREKRVSLLLCVCVHTESI